jgi:RNA polymerase sigma factor (sigma-70 family)
MHRPAPRPAAVTAVRPDDPLLAERALLGDSEAFDELYRRHRDRVARVAYLLLGDADQAQDTAQEAFLIGWRDLRRLRDPDLFRPWVTGIAVNLCRRRSRAVARELNHRADLSPPVDRGEVAEAAALRIEVRHAVEELPRKMREAIVLRFYCGFAEAEIAEALKIPLGTVKSRLGRARARLAVSLQAITEVDK